MKKIKQLEEFGKLQEGVTPEKAKMRFEISSNLKKVTRIQKGLIDIQQFLTEMSDEIIALNLNYSKLDNESKEIIGNMKVNIDNMLLALKAEQREGSQTGMIDNSERLGRNLERLKHGYVNKQQQ